MRLGISAILLIFPKFRRTRKLFWIVVAIECGPLSLRDPLQKGLAGRAAGYFARPAARPVMRGSVKGMRGCNGFALARQRIQRGARRGGLQPRPAVHTARYLTSTFAPAASSFFLSSSASAFGMPALTSLGAPSTRSFASLRPRPVIARTSLITLILFAPASARTTVNSVFSSAGRGGGGAAARGHHHRRGGGGDAPLLLELLHELGGLHDGEAGELIDDRVEIGHDVFFLLSSGRRVRRPQRCGPRGLRASRFTYRLSAASRAARAARRAPGPAAGRGSRSCGRASSRAARSSRRSGRGAPGAPASSPGPGRPSRR